MKAFPDDEVNHDPSQEQSSGQLPLNVTQAKLDASILKLETYILSLMN